MSRLRPYWLLGFVVLGLVALSVGNRPALKAQQPNATVATSFVGGAFGGGDEEPQKIPTAYLPAPPMTLAETKIRLKLQERIAMNFPNETPLEDILKYIQQTTIDKVEFPDGLPIYVDPVGLQNADRRPDLARRHRLEGHPAGDDPEAGPRPA